MKLKCHICGKYNGSCNQYPTLDGKGLTICPACLAWSNAPIAKWIRQAQKNNRLVKAGKGGNRA